MKPTLLLAGVLIFTSSPSLFATDASVRGERLFASCANCHGTSGNSVANTFPALAGRSRDDIITAMRAFKSGTRPATVMHQLSKAYSDNDIELIAGFLAAQPISAKK